MTVTAKCLVESKFIEAVETSQYTASVRTIIDKCTLAAPVSTNTSVTLKIVPSGGTAGGSNIVMAAKVMTTSDPTYTCPEIVGHILNPGDIISTLSTVASSVSLRISGREVS